MTVELKSVWICKGCKVAVRNLSGEEIPEPRKWEDSRCPRCRVDHAREIGGKEAADELAEMLGKKRHFRKPIKADKSAGPSEAFEKRRDEVRAVALAHPDWNSERIGKEVGISTRSASRIRTDLGMSKKTVKKRMSDEDRARVKEALSGPILTDLEISERLGLDPIAVAEERRLLGVPGPQRRERAARQKAVLEAVVAHPEWTNDQLAEALDMPEATVKKDRRELGLPIRKRGGQAASTAA